MAKLCFVCGKKLTSVRDSFIYDNKPICRSCLNKLEGNAVDETIENYGESESFIRKRHRTIRGLVRFNNFFGWLFVITIIFLPLGLLLLLQGHLILANLEIEHNTRETAATIKKYLEKHN